MNESKELAITEDARAALTSGEQSQQFLAIDPVRYVGLVFEPFREKLARYKVEADAVTFDASTAAGMKTAIEWRAKFRDEIRIAAESVRKERKAPILEVGRLLDGRAKELANEVAPYEARFDEAIKSEDAKRAAEKKAREAAEALRVQEIQKRLAKLSALAEVYTSVLAPARILEVIEQIEGGLTYDYQEFADQAEAARQAALVALRRAHIEAVEREECQAAAEAARAAREALEAEERAEAERLAAEARAAEEARIAEERARLEAEQAEARRQREAQEALARAEHARLAEEERRARVVREAEAERQLERIRLEREAEERRAAAERARLAEEADAQRKRQAIIDAENARIRAEQTERQIEIERREREHREAEEARRAALQAELDRTAAEAARQREAEQRRAALALRLARLTAADVATLVADALGVESELVASRLAEIPHADWVALAMSEEAA